MSVLSNHLPEVLARLNAVPEHVDEPRQDDAPAEWQPRPLTPSQAEAMARHHEQPTAPAVSIEDYEMKVNFFFGFAQGVRTWMRISSDPFMHRMGEQLEEQLTALAPTLKNFRSIDYLFAQKIGCTCQSFRNGD
jgi:hypothetical protein